MNKQDLKKLWCDFLIDEKITNVDIANKLHITRSAVAQRINNGSIKFLDLANILESYGYTIKIEKKW